MNIFDAYTVAASPAQAEGPAPCVDSQSNEVDIDNQYALEDAPTPRPLFNARQPLYTLKSEKPEHRAIILMKAAAMSNKEIANAIGWTAQAVMYVVKQPWAQEQILKEIESAGREPVMQLLHTAAFESAERLIEIARNAEGEECRRKANNDILNRVLGMPNQKIETSTAADASKLTEKEIDERLAKLYAKRAN